MLYLSWQLYTTGQSNLIQDSLKDVLFYERRQDTGHLLGQEIVLHDFLIPASAAKARGKLCLLTRNHRILPVLLLEATQNQQAAPT